MTQHPIIKRMILCNDIATLDATMEAADEFGHGFGSELMGLKPEHIEALQSGKMLAWSDGEYVTFVTLVAE